MLGVQSFISHIVQGSFVILSQPCDFHGMSTPKSCPSSIYNISNLFFFLFFLVSLVTYLLILKIFFKESALSFIVFLTYILFSISLICSKSYNFFSSAYLDLILFPLLVFCAGKLYYCFLHLLNFLIYAFNGINLSLNTALIVSHTFWCYFFNFYFHIHLKICFELSQFYFLIIQVKVQWCQI